MSLRLKVVAYTEDLKLLAKVMRSYPKAQEMNTNNCALEGFELFISTRRKLNLLCGSEYESHCLDKIKYSSPLANPRLRRPTLHVCWS